LDEWLLPDQASTNQADTATTAVSKMTTLLILRERR